MSITLLIFSGDLSSFGWNFHTSSPVTNPVSQGVGASTFSKVVLLRGIRTPSDPSPPEVSLRRVAKFTIGDFLEGRWIPFLHISSTSTFNSPFRFRFGVTVR